MPILRVEGAGPRAPSDDTGLGAAGSVKRTGRTVENQFDLYAGPEHVNHERNGSEGARRCEGQRDWTTRTVHV